jgi:hypothetical protein
MIQKVVKKMDARDFSEIKENLEYWLSKNPSERVEAVELLRKRVHGIPARLQRVAHVVQLPQS